jgi:transcriptional regulator with XRE-family HTH domain
MTPDASKFYERLGASLSAFRRSAGITQDELGAKVGLSRTSITNIEKGRQVVYAHLLPKVAGALSVPISALLAFAMDDQALPAEAQDLPAEQQAWLKMILTKESP